MTPVASDDKSQNPKEKSWDKLGLEEIVHITNKVGLAYVDAKKKAEHLELTRRQVDQWVPVAAHQLAHDERVEHGAARGHGRERAEEVVEVADPVLEQVADAAVAGREQVVGVGDLDVLREHHQPGLRPGTSYVDRGTQPLVGVAGRHPDVDDADVRALLEGGGDERRPVGHRADHLVAGLGEQQLESLAQQQRVVRDHDPHSVILLGGSSRRASSRPTPGR